jgi:predicted DCC family thiol-disulfide oxidoreductase YuxK
VEVENPIVLFDGTCNFCNGSVNFLIRQDKRNILRFAALQSEAGKKLLQQYNLPADYLQSFVLIENGKAFQQSAAALKVLGHLPWYWKWTQPFWLVPSFVRNGVYNFIAKNRYRWFGRRQQCMVPSAELKGRFL